MLFGRKKPGFVQVVTTGNEAEENVAETAQAVQGDRKELLDYLASLPDAEDEFADAAQQEQVQDQEEPKELTKSQKLAEYIRLRSAAAQLTAYQQLREEDAEIDTLLGAFETEEGCEDIASVKGEKDTYYYSTQNMSANYAMIAALVEEKDLVRTMAQMARWNCKTYPVPTPLSYFERHPYYATKPQIDRSVDQLTGKEEYQDVKLIQNSTGVPYLYSTEYMSEKYARALVEPDEFVD